MDDSKNRKFGVVLSYFSIVVNTLVQLLYTPVLIRNLGQSEYGLYSLVSSIIGYLTILDLGFGNAIIVYTSKYRAQGKIEEEKKLHGMFNLVFKIIGVIAACFGLILYFNVNNLFGSKMTDIEIHKMQIMMLILSFNLFLTFYFAIYNSIINAYEMFTFQKIVSIIHSLLKPLLMLPLLLLGYKSIALCIIITISNVFTLLTNFIYCRKKLNIDIKFCGFNKSIFKIILGYSMWIFLGTIVDKINWSVDEFILGTVSGTVAVSIYSIASILNQLFINLSTAISGVFLPKMSKLIVKKVTSDELTNEMIKVGRLQTYIIFLMCTGLIIFGRQFIMLWAGESFEKSYYVALILIIPACFSLVQNLGLSIMQAMNKYKFKSISNFIMSFFNILISIFLAKKYGPIGAAIGTAFLLVICNIFMINIYYYKVIKLNIVKFWKSILNMIVKLAIPAVVISIVVYNLNLKFLPLYFFVIIIYIIMYLLVSYKFVMNDYEKNILVSFFKKIKGGLN